MKELKTVLTGTPHIMYMSYVDYIGHPGGAMHVTLKMDGWEKRTGTIDTGKNPSPALEAAMDNLLAVLVDEHMNESTKT